MTSPELDLAELRKIAGAATEGPWFVHDFSDPQIAPNPSARDVTVSCDHPATLTVAEMAGGFHGHKSLEQARKDAAHIARFDPPTVLALIKRVEDAEARAQSCLEDCRLPGKGSQREDALRARLAAAQKRIEGLEAERRLNADLPPPRYFNCKHEFYRGDSRTFEERKAAAVKDLSAQGDICEVIINEGDWGMLLFKYNALRVAARALDKGEGE